MEDIRAISSNLLAPQRRVRGASQRSPQLQRRTASHCSKPPATPTRLSFAFQRRANLTSRPRAPLTMVLQCRVTRSGVFKLQRRAAQKASLQDARLSPPAKECNCTLSRGQSSAEPPLAMRLWAQPPKPPIAESLWKALRKRSRKGRPIWVRHAHRTGHKARILSRPRNNPSPSQHVFKHGEPLATRIAILAGNDIRHPASQSLSQNRDKGLRRSNSAKKSGVNRLLKSSNKGRTKRTASSSNARDSSKKQRHTSTGQRSPSTG